MKKIKGYNIVKEKTNELLVSIEIGNDEVIERNGYKVIPFYEEENPTIEQNAGENQIEGGVVSVSGSVDKSEDECNPRICEKCFAENCIGCHKNDMFKAKPESNLRPFKDCDELVECWERKIFIPVMQYTKQKVLFRPEIWVKSKEYGTDNLITAFDNDNESIGGSCVFIQDMWVDMKELFDNFTFLDGSPCGKEE